MSFNSGDLVRVTSADITSAYLTDELGFYAAFLRYVQVSGVLRDSDLCHREAYFQLLYGIEIFLKDIFCTLRFLALGGFNQLTQTTFAGMPETIRKKIAESCKASSYQHDLRKIAGIIQEFCPNLKTDADFQSLLGLLPPDGKWVEHRYEDPADRARTEFQVELQKLEAALAGIRERTFGRFR